MVYSESILNIHYDSVEKKLIVSFMSGGKYEYADVKYSVYDDFIHAKSKGKFFADKIKGHYTEKKIY